MIPKDLKQVDEVTWEISKQGDMRVPARIIATKKLLKNMDEGVFKQVSNVATLPGIQKYALCHADGHWGLQISI